MEICQICGKQFETPKQLWMHKVGKHRKPLPEPQPQAQEQAEQPQPPNLLEKLKALGIEPDQVMQVLSPLVETSVVKTLEKMQLGEAINKKVSEVETRLSGQIKQTLEPLQQAAGGEPAGGDNQPQDTQLRDTILAGLAQKFLNPSSGGSLEQITKTLEFASNISTVVMKPYMEGQAAARREMNETFRLITGVAKLTPQQQAAIAATLGRPSPD